ncbi:lipopolysaccharide core heptose(I) kinase RfaP [Candidatus Uabimicrobium amorphum]|uniref:Lipopolysaccharide core heptose(I) kinase RfaP n=1 Tax=Uabimicrobium amorphum TaxID=2596890 RepID=A0A5S9IHA5_UABAM|nr:lipopolysaccharide core heptose(I) kinase RfaP [Candidatus Uabimicrobium amorphum]BBM81763.1 lipopolysaccharide core heptose(I) kinase RfaP [Candidatus Uabimicrobium amorphum]
MFYLRDDLQQALSPRSSFEDIMKLNGKTYRKVKNRHTFSVNLNDKTYFIKQHTGVGWKEIFKELLRFKIPVLSAKNEWHAIDVCRNIGINTMEVAGYGKKGLNPASQKSFLVTDELTGVETLEDFAPRFFAEASRGDVLKKALIKSVAEIARKLHQQNITHHDMYICHFWIDNSKWQRGQIYLYLIDLHRAQYHTILKKRYIIKDLAAIYFSSMDLPLTKNDISLFMETYHQQPLSWIEKHELLFWQEVRRKAIKLYHKIHKKEPPSQNE